MLRNSPMKLIGTPTSPYTRKARVVLAEKKIDYEFVVDVPYEADSHVSDFNPLGKVPVLVLDDDTTVFDSRVIVEYLDHASPVARLIPENTRQRIQARRWEALADGCTDATVALVVERRRPAALQWPDAMARQQQKVERALDAMAQELGAKSWCCGGFLQSVGHRGRLLSGLSRSASARPALAQDAFQPRTTRRQARAAAVIPRQRAAAGLSRITARAALPR